MSATPLDDIRSLISTLPGPDEQARAAAAAGLSQPGGLGRLEEIALWLAAWSGKVRPQLRRPILALYAGAPGPGHLDAAEMARAKLEAVAAGKAAVSRLAQAAGAGLEAFDLAIDRPIGDMAVGPALGDRECAATMAFGMEVLAKQPDLLMVAEIETSADNARAVMAAVRAGGDGLDILRRLGSRQIAAAAGAILGARMQKTPVILDGPGPIAAAAALRLVDPRAADHCLIAQAPGFDAIDLPLAPLLDLACATFDGTGALAALSVVKLAGAVLDPE
ncbi:MAG: nicotinate-nucleotide--dimethylbenzimidazole phosphoribosyltransferase [Caulobacteraceae bacterium]|nr:nicotinate-nucleotide--dimethylbenzimidazole phosphoribosyltransferase [Caulobacteraceae bacterium]